VIGATSARALRVEPFDAAGVHMQYRVEPGEFKLWIGPHSARGLEASFALQSQ